MEIHRIGIDLAKTIFHLVGIDARGEVVVRKKFSRLQLLRFTANRPACLIGMEACGGAHFLGRALPVVFDDAPVCVCHLRSPSRLRAARARAPSPHL